MSRVAASALLAAIFLGACASGPGTPDWQLNAAAAMRAYEQRYLTGGRGAEAEFARARSELARSGREDLVARLELARCAVRAASLEFDACPGFEALRAGAGAEELAYADYLQGRGSRAVADEPLSRLVAAAIRLRRTELDPAMLAQAIDIASAQGWRRPLLAWLGVQAKRAEDAGDAEAAARIRRRMALVSG